MPEIDFCIRWPDGTEQTCNSPSTILRDHLVAGATYSVAEFLKRNREGFKAASDRVEAKYGLRCSAAASQLARIEAAATGYEPEEIVTCLSVS